MRIQNNVSAMGAHRNYTINQTNMTKSIGRLSSGYRINSAADDAAGLAISEKMRAQIRGLTMASKNAQDAISLIQTAEGGMQEIDNMLQRIRELVNYASNDTQEHNSYMTGDRQKIQDEINQLTQEIDSMSDRVEFNKKKLINGEVAGVPKTDATGLLERLATAKDTMKLEQTEYSIAVKDFKDATTGAQAARDAFYTIFTDPQINTLINQISINGGTGTAQLTTALQNLAMAMNSAKTTAAISGTGSLQVSGALALVRTAVANLGSGTSTNSALANTYITNLYKILGSTPTTGNLSTAYLLLTKNYTDYDTARTTLVSATSDLTNAKSNLALKQAELNAAPKTGGLYFQVGANATQGVQLYISSIKTDWLNIGDGNGVSTISVLDDTGADITAQLDTLDFALSYVTTERAKLGAAQNRLEYTMNSLDISAENLTAAEARIRDVDMAKEMSNFTKQNILFQASTAMLAQANAMPQGVLQLLG